MFAEQGVDLGGLGLGLEVRASVGVEQGDGRALGVLVDDHLSVGLHFELEGRADDAVSDQFADVAVFGGGVHIGFLGFVWVAGCIYEDVEGVTDCNDIEQLF